MVLVARQAPDFTASAVLGNGEIVDNFNFKKHVEGKAAVIFLLAIRLYFRLSIRNYCIRPPLSRIQKTWC